jgi:L-ribulose-5-phosphate 4-epimerase
MLENLKSEVSKANIDLVEKGLVIETWGNASGIDRKLGLMVIKPSGVPYNEITPHQMVVVSLATGKVVEGDLEPSSDSATHLVLYRALPNIGGVVHTHSLFATAWAQACKPLLAYGTTQADYWFGEVPCTRPLNIEEIKHDYEANTGYVIVETLKRSKIVDPLLHPGVLVANHGPFVWGKNVADAVHKANVLEFIARLASETLRINTDSKPIQNELLKKHHLRKHGPGAYYGQTR